MPTCLVLARLPVRFRLFFGCVAVLFGLQATGWGQFLQSEEKGPRLGESAVRHWQAGVVISARSGPCQGLLATAPIPVDWPEQEAKIVDEQFSPMSRVTYRVVDGRVRQMVVYVPFLPGGAECRSVVTVEVTRRAQLLPEDPESLVLPDKRRIPRDVRVYLGPSPEIESTSARVKSLARELDLDEEKPWAGIEAIYDWVRENVEHTQAHQGGALAALEEGQGDHEDLTSVFIALCRASGVPARTVWVPSSCYPEFYLEDSEGEGAWYPCNVAVSGDRVFGQMSDLKPILQKGDNFRSPDNRRERKRYLPETVKGKGGQPSVRFIREQVAE